MDPKSNQRKELLRNALALIDDLQAKVAAHEAAAAEPVAIVGLGCRYPGSVRSAEDFWKLLDSERCVVSPVPDERWRMSGFEPPDVGGRTVHAGLLDALDQFDPAFFGISAREAVTMDPQQRLILETAWEALENAGCAPDRLAGSPTGVFIGITTSDYAEVVRAASAFDVYAATGGAHNAAAGRLSYVLGLEGPSISIDTACSSSLVALHLAVNSLRSRQCDLALAGGVNVTLTPGNFVCFSNWGMMAPDGRCKAFDAAADGFVRAEGCGILVLKRLSDALKSRDPIHALIRGTAVNQDGRSGGLTVPNGRAQEAVVRRALANARVEPRAISYLEAHGTGTSLGDPIELNALASVFRGRRDPLPVGSVKTNIGHAESAAGVAGVIKTVLALRHRRIPASLHFERLNPRIELGGTPIEVARQARDWERGDTPRLAGVSSFGFSGTNAHVVIEEAPPPATSPAAWHRPRHVVCLSGRSDDALEQTRIHVAHAAAGLPPAEIRHAAHTLNTGRPAWQARSAWIAGEGDDLQNVLNNPPVARGTVRAPVRVAFLFPGQGAQFHGMGRDLYESHPVFRAVINECREAAAGLLDRDLMDVLTGTDERLVGLTRYTQPALFAIEIALARLWQDWGVEPAWVLGHSLGEYAAACVAGLWPVREAMALVVERGRLMEEHGRGGAMLALEGTADWARSLIHADPALSLAAENAPERVVVSGDTDAIERLEARLAAEGRRTKRLDVSEGFHSRRMDEVSRLLSDRARAVARGRLAKGFVSTLTGTVVTERELADGAYWGRQAREPVLFRKALATLLAQGCTAFVEVGPGSVLTGLARECGGAEEALWLPGIGRQRCAWTGLLRNAAELWVRGVPVDWQRHDQPYEQRRIALPGSVFERQSYWVKPARASSGGQGALHPMLASRTEMASAPGTHVFEGEISVESHPFIADHVVQGRVIVPATAYLELAGASARALGLEAPLLHGIEYRQPMHLEAGEARVVQVVLEGLPHSGSFRVYSRPKGEAGEWTLHAVGGVDGRSAGDPDRAMDAASLGRAQADGRELSGAQFYEASRVMGNEWGPAFQALQRVWILGNEAWADVRVPESIREGFERHVLHPALADAGGHALAALLAAQPGAGAFVGAAIDGVRTYRTPEPGDLLRTHARLRETRGDGREVIGDVDLFDSAGRLVSELRGAHLWILESSKRAPRQWYYAVKWEPAPRIAVMPGTPERSWLVFADRAGLGTDVARSLRARGARCRVVEPGEELQLGPDRGTWRIRVDSAEDYRALLSEMPDGDVGILHAWACDAPSGEDVSDAEVALRSGCGSILDLLRALKAARRSGDTRLWVITRGAHRLASEPVSVLQAPVWGICRSLAAEHAEIWGGLVDLEPGADPAGEAGHVLDTIVFADGEDQVAWRGGVRHVARITPAAPAEDEAFEPVIRPDRSYWITGGLGGLGLAAARWLAERGARHLVLMARTPLRRDDGGTGNDPRAEAVGNLAAMGCRVEVCAADVANEPELRAAMADLESRGMPEVAGVIHAAGIMRHKALAETTWRDLVEVGRAKIAGALALDRVLRGRDLDFVVLYSSASAVLPSPFLGAYAAANAMLDAIAHQWSARGRRTLSVNWGMWGEAGMATGFASDDIARLAERGMGVMSLAQGLDALGTLLGSRAVHAAVLPVEWRKWQAHAPAYARAPVFSRVCRPADAVPVRVSARDEGKRDLRAALREGGECARRAVAAVIAEVVGFPPETIDAEAPLTSLGVDSLMALELKNRFEREAAVSIPVVWLLEGPTLLKVVERLQTGGGESNGSGAEGQSAEVESADGSLDVDQLSDREVDALLARLTG